MRRPEDLKINEVSARTERKMLNRKAIEYEFDSMIHDSSGGIIELIGSRTEEQKSDYSDFLEEWGWECEFSEKNIKIVQSLKDSGYGFTVTTMRIFPSETNRD